MRLTTFGSVVATDFAGATHALIDILPGTTSISDVVYDYRGSSVAAIILAGVHKSFVYCKLNQHLVARTTDISAILAAHFADYPCYYNSPTSLDNIELYINNKLTQQQHKHNKPIKLRNKLQFNIKEEDIKNLPKTKITGEHHLHYTAQEIWDLLPDYEKRQARFALCLPSDSSTTFVAGVMLWLAILERELFELVLRCGLFLTIDQHSFGAIGKLISVRAKSLQNITEMDLRNIFEIDVLINRYLGDPIWEDEKEHRINPNLALVSRNEVYTLARELFSRQDNYRQKARGMEWKTFWAARWQWSATGSIHSQYLEDGTYIEKERELKNKFITLNKMPNFSMTKFLHRTPEIRAWASIKYEWAKQRAIYGTDLTSYVLTHFAFFNCEDTLPGDFPVGDKARPSYVSAKVEATLNKKEAFCLDFEDFNSQHSNQNMQAVMEAWLDVNKADLSEDQYIAGKWALESVGNTIIEDHLGTKSTYKSKGTLMSGWRLTTFMNSVLNYIYTKVCTRGVSEVPLSIHNGDDVLMGITKPSTIQVIMNNARARNIRVQSTKCAYGGIAEFLRVDHKRGEFGQYATRSIATLLHARIESKVAVSTVDYLNALESRLFDFKMRTQRNDIVVLLRNQYYSRMSKLYDITVHELFLIKKGHRVVGGISEFEDASVDYIVELEAGISEVELEEFLPGVAAYSEKIINDLEMKQQFGEVYKSIYRATLDAVQLVRKRCQVKPNNCMQQYRVLRGIYGAYSYLKGSVTLGKAMLTGFALDILAGKSGFESLISVMSMSTNPMLYLRVVC
jgi:hypothetical protein